MSKPILLTAALLILLAACATAQPATDAAKPSLGGCALFPNDYYWNTPVADLPLLPRSRPLIAAIGADAVLHADFGSGRWRGEPIGIPFNLVNNAAPRQNVTFEYAGESDAGPYPIPSSPQIEGGSDHHLLLLNTDSCVLYELYDAERGEPGWRAGSGAVFDLGAYGLRPDGWTSADAAGLPILPGLVRYQEVAAGEIRHALRFTAPRSSARHLWPARHHAATGGVADPPMGLWLRLRGDYDISGFPRQARVILRALQRYGMILADNGGPWFISGAPDERWDNDDLHELSRVRGADFEVVDSAMLMAEPDSGRAK